jgi:hypothetical protein
MTSTINWGKSFIWECLDHIRHFFAMDVCEQLDSPIRSDLHEYSCWYPFENSYHTDLHRKCWYKAWHLRCFCTEVFKFACGTVTQAGSLSETTTLRERYNLQWYQECPYGVQTHSKILYYSCHIFMFVNTPADLLYFCLGQPTHFEFCERLDSPTHFNFCKGLDSQNPFRFLRGMIGFSNPFRFLRWKLWMLHYCWHFDLQDDWKACCCAATAVAVPVIVSRLCPRLPAASLRGLLFPNSNRLNHGCREQRCRDQRQWGLLRWQGCQCTSRAKRLNSLIRCIMDTLLILKRRDQLKSQDQPG